MTQAKNIFSGLVSSQRSDCSAIDQTPNRVRVINGANEGFYPLAGKTVADVRKGLRDVFNLSLELSASVNGVAKDDATILQNGDSLEFCKAFGTKGGFSDFVSESEIRHLYGDEGYQLLLEAGLKPITQPVFSGHDVASFGRSLKNIAANSIKWVPFTVDIDRETLTYKGCTYEFDRLMGLVSQCLIEAGGEIRSTADIKRLFPNESWEERLDNTINRKLLGHKSGVGELFESVEKKGFRFRIEAGK